MIDFFKKNKKLFSAIAAGIAGFLYAYDQQEAATAVGMVAALLFGGGALPSDKEARRN